MYYPKEIENKVFEGNVLKVLSNFPSDIIDLVITSPPYYCFDKETEVLTINGWKKINIVKSEDILLTVNPDNFELEYQNIETIFKYYYKGKLFHFKGENIDLKITPNHSLFVKSYKLKTRNKIGRWTSNKLSTNFLFRKAENIKKNNKIPLRHFIWKGRKIDNFTIGEYKIPIEIWLEFFGWWISVGSVDGSCGGENRGRVKIKQKIYWNEVKLLLEKLPFKYKIYGDSFEIYYRPLHDYLIQFGNSHTKFLPLEIKSLEKRLLEIFWYAYMKGDGHKLKNSYSVSKQLNNDLQEIAMKLGLNSKIVGNMIYYKTDNFVRPINFLTKIKYHGYVYCISVENHTLISRRNGTPIVSGNSQRNYGPEINTSWDGDPLCEHKWEEFTRPGNTWSIPGPGLYGGKDTFNKAWVKPQIQAYCSKCRAWYGALGLEPTPILFIKHLVDIFRKVRRVLKPTGLFFLNIGDTYAGSQSGYGTKFPNPKSLQSLFKGQAAASVMQPPAFTCVGSEEWIKCKQLLLIPSRTAIAMQLDDGDDVYELREDLNSTERELVIKWIESR